MKASLLDLRRHTRRVIRALERNESVTILDRGREKGVLHPARRPRSTAPVTGHPAFGMWRDRADLRDVPQAVRRLRRGRARAL